MTFRSFISNSKLRRGITREILIIFVILLLAEFLVRILVYSNVLPIPYGLWNRREFPIVLFESERLNPEVFFVGNSITRNGVDTNEFIDTYTQIANEKIKAFNAGVSGTPVSITSTFAAEFLIPDHHPKAIIWVLRASDIDTFESEDWDQRWLDFLEIPEVKARLQSQFTIDDIAQNWWTWRFRHTLKYTLTHMQRPFGYTSQQKNKHGYVPLVKQAEPDMILQNNYMTDFTSSEIGTDILEMIEHFLQVATNHDVRVIFVIPPTLNHRYQDGDEYVDIEDQIISDLTSFVDVYDVPVYDERYLSYDEIVSFEEFQDTGHLNQYGAAIFSQRLAEIYLQEIENAGS